MLSVGRFPSAYSVNGYVLVAFFKGLAILRDFNGLRIENSNRDVLAAKFNRGVSRRNPALERRVSALLADSHSDVGPFNWANSNAILFS